MSTPEPKPIHTLGTKSVIASSPECSPCAGRWLATIAVSMVAVATLAGCVNSAMKKPCHPEFLLAVDSEGYIRDVDGERTTNHHRYLDHIFKNSELLAPATTNILIFIQGGLNGLDDAVDRADNLGPLILHDPKAPAYPVFIGWDANLFSSWWEHYYAVHRGQSDSNTATLLSSFTFAADMTRLVSHAPLSVFEQLAAGVQTAESVHYTEFRQETNSAIPKLIREVNKQYRSLHRNGDVTIMESASTNSFLYRGALMLAAAPPKILSEAAIDSLGKVGWEHMLRRTKTMFTRPGLDADYFQPGGTELFAVDLISYLNKHQNTTVTIVAHSMGSIVANELIRRHGDELHLTNIVYMAAACGVEDFDRNVVPFLLRNPKVQFYNLCLHPVNDSADSYRYITPLLEPVAPSGSLLEWVDDYYSTTETDYGRTLGKWNNVILGSKGFLSETRGPSRARLLHQIHIKGFGVGPEEQFGPQHHGGFDQVRFWDPDFWKPGRWDKSLIHHWKDDACN